MHNRPDDRAVALKYSSDLPAPFILAKGKNHLAERLRRIAAENDIRIIEDDNLVDSLFLFERGDIIPEHLYEAVAQILAFVYSVDYGRNKGPNITTRDGI